VISSINLLLLFLIISGSIIVCYISKIIDLNIIGADPAGQRRIKTAVGRLWPPR
jgi:hypothetical protein